MIRATSANGTVLDLTYGYGTSNNGAVASITNNLASGRSQSFTYDWLNRITTAQSTATSGSDCWGQAYGYDAAYKTNLSSITSSKCSSQTMSLTITSKNRISNTGFTYDNAGNLTADGTYTYAWNALNQLTSAGGVTYTYDGDGRRVKKSNGTLYWYGPGGSVLAETDLSANLVREFVYFNGHRIARRDSAGSIYYFFSDHLGTARVMTSATGVTQQESTYYPFGSEQRAITSTVDNRYRFTGLERDTETGLDHTQFRKYSPIQARWLSPDPVCSNCYDPQLLNRYSYVRNNPVNLIDPDGLFAPGPGLASDPWIDTTPAALWYYLWLWSGGAFGGKRPGVSSGGGGGSGSTLPSLLSDKQQLLFSLKYRAGVGTDQKGRCFDFLLKVVAQLKSDNSLAATFSIATLVGNISSARLIPTTVGQLGANAQTTDNTTRIASDPTPSPNDYLSTLLHEGFHLASTADAGVPRILDDVLYQAAARAAGQVPVTMPTYTDYSLANRRYFGTNCGPSN
jgi:RHS repeat-associated protein